MASADGDAWNAVADGDPVADEADGADEHDADSAVIAHRHAAEPIRLFAVAQGITIVSVLDDSFDRGLDRGGHGKIHIGDKGWDDVRVVLVPLGVAARLQGGSG